MQPLDEQIKIELNRRLASIGERLGGDNGGVDVMSIIGPISSGVEHRVRGALELKKEKTPGIAIILETGGGLVEVVERIVQTIRYFYQEVIVIVPNEAMSAGTVLALSADRIMMDYFSRLGPIDPQIVKDGKFIPALAYLNQYEKLNAKSAEGGLTTAEYAMLSKLDLGELYQFERAKALTEDLLINWLSNYKFKNWTHTESTNRPVTKEMKEARANAIAQELNNLERWHSHGRGIGINTLRNELNLKIDDFSKDEKLSKSIKHYFALLANYVGQLQAAFIHTEEFF